MHPVITSFLKQFAADHAVGDLKEEDQFELFANFAIFANRCPTRFDPSLVTTGQPEVGIDGAAVMIGDDIVTSADDARDIFKKRARDVPVSYLFVQAKRSEAFERNALLNLGSAVRDRVSEDPQLPHDEVLREVGQVHKVVVENMTKVRGGQPSCSLFYVTTGTWKNDAVLTATQGEVRKSIEETRLFGEVKVEIIGFEQLRAEWIATSAATEATFQVIREIPIPNMTGVSEALLLVVQASEFVDKVLTDADGTLRGRIFEQNVRHFLGATNEVNAQIQETLSNPARKGRFAILNNGVTIVANSVTRAGNTVALKDFFIVNGCQTSHVLFGRRRDLDDTVTVVVKAIQADDAGVVDELVVATNRQTRVQDSQFLAMKPEVRAIQSFFAAFPEDEDSRLYFERRLGEFAGKDVAGTRIFDVHLLAKVFASMFLDAPHYALGSPRRVYDDARLFDRSGIEIAYYTAAFTYYRLILMVGNKLVDRKHTRLKWHVLTAIRYQQIGRIPLGADSAAIGKACKGLLSKIWGPPKNAKSIIDQAVELLDDLGVENEREYRAKVFTDRLVEAAKPSVAK